jgi:hypothetical protein
MYYPFYLHLINLFSFTSYNNISENNIRNISNKSIDLWSITRWSYSKYKGTKTFTASYNYYTQNYEFNGKRYILYDDVINDALKL